MQSDRQPSWDYVFPSSHISWKLTLLLSPHTTVQESSEVNDPPIHYQPLVIFIGLKMFKYPFLHRNQNHSHQQGRFFHHHTIRVNLILYYLHMEQCINLVLFLIPRYIANLLKNYFSRMKLFYTWLYETQRITTVIIYLRTIVALLWTYSYTILANGFTYVFRIWSNTITMPTYLKQLISYFKKIYLPVST